MKFTLFNTLSIFLYCLLASCLMEAAPSKLPAPIPTDSPQATAAPATVAQIPREVTLQSLFDVANYTANQTTSWALDAFVFLATAYENNVIELPSCFQNKREESETNIDYMSRMRENYQTAAGYSDYYRAVMAFYNTTPEADPTRKYHFHLSNMKTTTEELKHAIANMIYQVDRTAYLPTLAPPTPVPFEKRHDAIADCTDLCLENLTRMTRHLHKFSLQRAAPDLAGFFKQQNGGK